MGISTTSQPRAKRKLDRAQPQEEGRHRSCAAPYGASAECQTKTTGSRPWLKFYRRYAAKMANLQTRAKARDYMLDYGFFPRSAFWTSDSRRDDRESQATKSCRILCAAIECRNLSGSDMGDLPTNPTVLHPN